jgi:predicted N-acetyltransferase YhbS
LSYKIAIGALNVKIACQRQGIGRMMVNYMYREYGLDNEMVIVQTTASAERFYERMGWKTMDSVDIDLSDWAGKGLGYGLLRSPQMVRSP